MKKVLSIFVVLFFTFFYCSHVSSQEIIAGWSGYKVINDSIAYASKGNSLNAGVATLKRINDERKMPISVNDDKFPNAIFWDASGKTERYWLVNFSTIGYSEVSATFKQYSSGTGPRDFTVQYRTDGQEWITLHKAAKIPSGSKWSAAKELLLPEDMENKEDVSLRWLVSSNFSVDGKEIGTGGSSRIDLSISGAVDNVFTSAICGTDISATSDEAPSITVRNGKVRIECHPSNPVLSVVCYDLRGQILSSNIGKETESFSFAVGKSIISPVLIKVICEKNNWVKKMVL